MSETLIHQVIKAIDENDTARLYEMYHQNKSNLTPDLLAQYAIFFLQHFDYDEAARMLNRIPHRNLEQDIQRNFVMNMRLLKGKNQALFDLMNQTTVSDEYRLTYTQDSQLTIEIQHQDDWISITPGNHAQNYHKHILNTYEDQLSDENMITIFGCNNGDLLQHLGKTIETQALGQIACVLLIEPNPILFKLMLHSKAFTGRNSPLRQNNFIMVVGTDWQKQLYDLIWKHEAPLTNSKVIELAPSYPDTSQNFASIIRLCEAKASQMNRELQQYYAQVSDNHWASIFSSSPPRQPRILILTSRFTTVLQYSARDTAHAFEILGWDVKLLIEQESHHRISPMVIMKHIEDFKPDLIFVINHLRHEYDPCIPKQLPFICWIQDEMLLIHSRASAMKQGPRDFIWSFSPIRYHLDFGYSLERTFVIRKSTPKKNMKPVSEPKNLDLTFVSNCSQLPETLIAPLLEANAANPIYVELIESCATRLIQHYANGDHVSTQGHFKRFLTQVVNERHEGRLTPDQFQLLHRCLWHPLNDTLYRQQALRWAASAAQKHGLHLALYGQGWEDHPEFSTYARGYAKYGDHLTQITRDSICNLQIVPYNYTHQRLIDGILCGGRYLIRDHPANHQGTTLGQLVLAHLPSDVMTYEAALRYIPNHLKQTFTQAADSFKQVIGGHDPIYYYRMTLKSYMEIEQREITKPEDIDLYPFYQESSFKNAEELHLQLGEMIANPLQAQQRASEQQAYIAKHFTYEDQIKSLVRTLSTSMQNEINTTEQQLPQPKAKGH